MHTWRQRYFGDAITPEFQSRQLPGKVERFMSVETSRDARIDC